jgi:hypothetical protein
MATTRRLLVNHTSSRLICSPETGSRDVRVFCLDFPGWGGAEDREGISIFGRPEGIQFKESPYEAVTGTNVVVILTEINGGLN